MPWQPNGASLRALREKRGWTLEDLAEKSGVSDRQIRAIESPHPPATIQMRTIRDLTGALKCEREDIATWLQRVGTAAPGRVMDRVMDRVEARAESPVGADSHGGKLPPASTLARRAALERKAQVIARRLTGADGAAVEVLGFDRLYEVGATFADHDGRRFGVEGQVTEHRPTPPYVEPILDVQTGIGAQFLVVRTVAREPLYVSVFTRSLAHTRRLIEAERAERAVSLITRVVVARPRGEWKGFFIFEKRPKPHPWALLVEEVV